MYDAEKWARVKWAGKGDIAVESSEACDGTIVCAMLQALAGAVFGVGTPLTKLLLGQVAPIPMAALLYLGAGVGIALFKGARRVTGRPEAEAPLSRRDLPWFVGAILSVGVAAPIVLMFSLQRAPAATVSLLLKDPMALVMYKGLGAGAFSLRLGSVARQPLPSLGIALAVLALGVVSYGASIVLYVLGLRALGAARTGALFGTAPFKGAVLSLVIFRASPGVLFAAAVPLMVAGAVLLLGKQHHHAHAHEALDHDHRHRHDDAHHVHTHPGMALHGSHVHPHRHDPMTHAHPHVPDIHRGHPEEAPCGERGGRSGNGPESDVDLLVLTDRALPTSVKHQIYDLMSPHGREALVD